MVLCRFTGGDFRDCAEDFVPQDRRTGRRAFAAEGMQITAAQRASGDAHEQFPRFEFGQRRVDDFQIALRAVK